MSAILALADGTYFYGNSIGIDGFAIGEVVFNTSMMGYQEIITDPSYARQIINFTCSHIGNTGINLEDGEASKVSAVGVVVRECSTIASNWRKIITFSDWLKGNKIVGISDINTRQLTKHIRDFGVQYGCIMAGVVNEELAIQKARNFNPITTMEILEEVTTKKVCFYESFGNDKRIVVLDFGVKKTIVKSLINENCDVVVVPANASVDDILGLHPDGIVLSNGPGNPGDAILTIEKVKALITTNIPILGICLGFQLLGLAYGGKTFKLGFGHHGSNHPVQELDTNRVFITSQNHNFAIDENSIPNDLIITHRSLFDKTIQGFKHIKFPVFGYQWHPEASPGPHDSKKVWQDFTKIVRKRESYAEAN